MFETATKYQVFVKLVLLLLHRDAWYKLGDKCKKDCMLEYIDRLLELDEEWEEKVFSLPSECSCAL